MNRADPARPGRPVRPARPVATAPIGAVAAVRALAGAELRLLVRNRLVAFTALVMPLLLGVFLGLNPAVLGVEPTPALQVVVVLALAVYAGAATSLTARRQDGYLKRLRSGEIGDAVLLTGLLVPVVVLGLAQALVLAAATVVVGLPAPSNPLTAVVGILAGAALFAAAAVATAGLTRSPETAQITTLPLFLIAILGGFLVVSRPAGEVAVGALAVPGAGVAELVRLGWAAPVGAGGFAPAGEALLALGATAWWVLVAVLVARARFRWDPRS